MTCDALRAAGEKYKKIDNMCARSGTADFETFPVFCLM